MSGRRFGAALLVAVALGADLTAGMRPAAAQETTAAAPVHPGPRLYRRMCAQCHGANMVSGGAGVYDLRRFPEDAHERFVTSVMGGKGAMPAWGGTLSAEEVEALWDYVRTRGRPS